jgi:hypothetical protein
MKVEFLSEQLLYLLIKFQNFTHFFHFNWSFKLYLICIPSSRFIPIVAIFFGSLASSSFCQTNFISLLPDSIKTTLPDSIKTVDSISTKSQILPVKDTIQIIPSHSNAPIPEKTRQSNAISLKQSWGYTLPMHITGVSICDIDNDKLMETLIISQNKLLVFRFTNKSFTKIAEYKASRGTQFLAIDAADLNGNGKPEIFVTACNAQSNFVTSFIGEFENRQFKILQKKIPYFLRVLTVSDGTKVLFGQDFSDNGVNYGKMYRFSLSNQKFSVQEKIPFPREHSILSLSTYRNKRDSLLSYLCFSSHGNIELINFSSYQSEMESSDLFSGGPSYMLLPTNETNDENRSYLPIRTLSEDLNNDSVDEIIAVKNYELTNNILQSFKIYIKTHIEIFNQTKGLSLTSIWKSVKFNGFISDLTFGDYNNDGKKEVVIAKALKTDVTIFTKPLSEIDAFTIQ